MSAFDYIVVGSGSAGSVLAAKLSADPRNQVLLVEEGVTHDDWLSRMPKGFGKQLMDPQRTHFIPTGNTKEGNQPEVWVRGKQFGGSSAVNGMVWTRGQQPDWDELADLGGSEWSWSEMLRVYKSIENHADGESETRGVGGPIAIKTNPEPSGLTKAWVEAGVEMGLPLKSDQNQLEQEGIGLLQWNIDSRGRRVSTGRAFIAPARSRSNLRIESGVRVDRVVVENGRAVAVEGVREGQTVRFACKGEIVLSAGAIGSVRILQLSGIGPGSVLQMAGVPVLLDQPDIGRHMREHVLVMQNWRMRAREGCENWSYSGINLFANVARYALLGSGPMAHGSSDAVAWPRVLPGSVRPDVQIMFSPYSLDPTRGMAFEDKPGFSTYSMVTKPQSEGLVEIASADPAQPLRIDPNYLAAERDRQVQLAAIRWIREMMKKPAIAGLIDGETDHTIGIQSDQDIIDWFHARGQAGYHAVGTVRVGRENAPLDSRLRLRGIEGLRVCDCSVYPEMIAGNTNAPTIALGYRLSELMLEDARA
jgi:choline dehydrogenase